MIRFAADENFNNHILHALVREYPNLDIVRVQDIFRQGTSDDIVLQRCATDERILLTHDVSTMIEFAYRRVEKGLPMSGVWEVNEGVAISDLLEDLTLLIECCSSDEFLDRVIFIPLR